MRVFISSTSEDLKDHRRTVEQVVLDAQWTPVGMEHFPNDPRPIVQLCREEVAARLEGLTTGNLPGVSNLNAKSVHRLAGGIRLCGVLRRVRDEHVRTAAACSGA